MNIYGVATGTDAYSLKVPGGGYELGLGDIVTVRFQNANTGPATLSINDRDPIALSLNGNALSAGNIVAGKDIQFTFTGVSLNLDAGASTSLSASDIPNLDASKITTGKIALARGGTNADLSSTGGTSQILKQSSAGGNITVGTITSTEAMAGFTGTKDNSVFMRGDGAMSNTFSGLLSVGGGATILESAGARKSTDVSGLTIAGGSAYTNSNGAMVDVRGNSNVSGPGEVRIYAGTSGSVRIFDTGGNNSVSFIGGEIRLPAGNTATGSSSERNISSYSGDSLSFRLNVPTGGYGYLTGNGTSGAAWSNSLFLASTITAFNGANLTVRTWSDTAKAFYTGGSTSSPANGAVNECCGATNTDEPGANIRRSTGFTQAASTSKNRCAVNAKDAGSIYIYDNNAAGGESLTIKIAAGAIASITGDTTTYTTSAPTSGQCQVSISGGFLVTTTGSAWTKPTSVKAQLGRMP